MLAENLARHDIIMAKNFERELRRLPLSGGDAPHKPCFLLAVIDAIESGVIVTNKIYYEQRLLKRFERYFIVARRLPKHFKPYYPFVYLGSSSFWNLHGADGQVILQEKYGHERRKLVKRGICKVFETVAYASLDETLFQQLLIPSRRKRYREILIDCYFQGIVDGMWAAVREARSQMQFEREFGELWLPPGAETLQRETKSVIYRDPNFRRAVLHAYNYSCAATGWQLKTNDDDGCLLEAAHIVPISERIDNSPENGMALMPTVHKAMDEYLVAPGPDLKWHASKFLKDQAATDKGAEWLRGLHGKPVLLPKDKRLHPAMSALEWRHEEFRQR